jgi:hypothetical protein
MSLKSTFSTYKFVANKNMVCLVKNSKNSYLKFCFKKKKKKLKPIFEKKLKSES